jgi:predicted ATP-binding protein involved in virulence
MHLKNITLTNYRCFEKLEIDLHPRLTVFVGDNGAGKTAVLDGIALALSPVLRHLSSANQRLSAAGSGIKDTDFRVVSQGTRNGKEQWGASDFAQVAVETTDGLKWDNWRPAMPGKEPSHKIGEVELRRHLGRILESMNTATPEILPVFAYYGAQRGRIEIPDRLRASKDNYSHPTSALVGALDSLSDFREMLMWFDAEEASELRAMNEAAHDEDLRSEALIAVALTIKTLLGGKYYYPHFNRYHKFILVSKEGGVPMQVSQLSQGYQSMLALGMDFARRLALANPHLRQSDIKDYGAKMRQFNPHRSFLTRDMKSVQLLAPAIMLVDEIDLHLHPSWQQRVLADLMRAFPDTQFIVTTHSPQVLSTVRRENIRVIKRTESGYIADMPDMSPLARQAGDALAYVMDVNVRPPMDDILEDVHAYEQLVRHNSIDSQEAIALKTKLDESGYQIPDADMALWTFLGSQYGSEGGNHD